MKIIELNNISKSFGRGSGSKPVLNGISLTISQGEFVVLRGMNGSGKTTLLNIILGLLKPDSGEAKLFGRLPEEAESKASVGAAADAVVPSVAGVDVIPVEEQEGGAGGGTTTDREIIYLRYDDVNMNFVYLCPVCDSVWNTTQ
jgi:energy-coupling factor transporter ATP-binding protein EcfA2